MEYSIDKGSFQAEVVESKGPVLIDFYADWCGPCRSMMPVVGQLAEEYEGTAKVAKVNVDQEPELAMSFGVSSIPCFCIMRDGKVVDRVVGAVPKAELTRRLDAEA